MKGIRFYEEFIDRSKRRPLGTAVAALVGNGRFWSGDKLGYEAVVGVFSQPNSPVAGSAVSLEYLCQRCKRISEARARSIHPAAFDRLD